jgi:hypothetical protein
MCVRAFEDRNSDGQKSDNEPFITRGLSASLANEQGVIVATMFIESSANASGGTMCFQRLAAGQYSIRISSADYMATTTNEFIGVVSDTGIPVVFPFGGQLIPIEVPQAAQSDNPLELSAGEQQAFFLKLVFAGIGAVVIMGAMTVVGAIIYFAFLRNQTQAMPTTKGTYPRVPDTGAYADVNDSDSYLPLDDTDHGNPAEEVDEALSSMYEDTDLPRATVLEPPAPYEDAAEDDFSFEPDDEADEPDDEADEPDDEADEPDSAFRPPYDDDPDSAFRPKG